MADSDLTQYDGTPAWVATADVGTAADPYFEPTDFKKITALDNGLNKAPVNRALSRAKDLLIGLRGAVFGDFTGAVQRTLKSLQVTGLTAGAISTANLGDIETNWPNGAVRASDGNVYAAFSLIGGLECLIGGAGSFARLRNYKLDYEGTGTGTFDANPPLATVVKNQLRAKNIPKAYGWISLQAGAIAAYAGFGNWVPTLINSGAGSYPDRISVALNDAMDNVQYAVEIGVQIDNGSNAFYGFILTDTVAANLFEMAFINVATGVVLNLSQTFRVTFTIHGQQTT